MIDTIHPFLLAFASLGAFELGRRVRDVIHVILPYKDPITLLIFALCLSPVIQSGLKHPFIDVGNIWYLAFVLSFVLCYSISYVRGDLQMVYVNIHTIVSERFPGGAQEVKPVVYYWDRDGNQYLQEQSFKEILKTVVFGIRSPLRLDTGTIRRTRPLFVSKVLYPTVAVHGPAVVREHISRTTHLDRVDFPTTRYERTQD